MSKKAPEVTYQIARPHQLPQIQKLMYASFNRDEPMTRHLKLHQGAFSIPDIDGMVEGLVMDHNLSLMALDSDQLPIAVALNGAFHREEIDMPRQEIMTTSPAARGLGLCSDILARSLMLARALGFKAAKAEATGDISKKAFLALGFTQVAEVKYAEYEFQGQPVFRGVEHQGCAFMVKMLD